MAFTQPGNFFSKGSDYRTSVWQRSTLGLRYKVLLFLIFSVFSCSKDKKELKVNGMGCSPGYPRSPASSFVLSLAFLESLWFHNITQTLLSPFSKPLRPLIKFTGMRGTFETTGFFWQLTWVLFSGNCSE